ncbi:MULTISPECIES: flagellar motor protein MotA [unclassified Alsobacter]|jgi:hypothetical protein|uniref:Flagellar motor protein MotA n=1 Tax=Alsobacter sp. KACC 23698 TaxID=3149229 RepID=A0AAU7JCS5_9HYPH
MAIPLEIQRLSSPRRHLLRMAVFLILAGFVALILYKAIWAAFLANPGLNALIIGVLFIGVILAFRQVIRLFREIRWVNAVRAPNLDNRNVEPPVLLAPMATILLSRQGPSAGTMTVTPAMLRSLLDSVGMRLDESRDIGRYLTGLLVFLGLLGTFWGLLETVGSVGRVIQSMKSGADAALMFEDLKSGLAAPLSGMGISFSSSLFGLAGSLVLGFLDLQAAQAQNRFYNEVEDWLSTAVAEPAPESLPMIGTGNTTDVRAALDRLSFAVQEATGSRGTTAALANLAEGIQALVHHMRSEQQLIRDWVESQAGRDAEMKKLLERLAAEDVRR